MLGYLVVSHLLGLLVFLNLSPVIGLLYTLLMVLLLGASFAYCYANHYRLLGKRSVRRLYLTDNHCVLTHADGREIKADLASRHYVSSWLVIVDLKPRASMTRKQLVLFAGAVPAGQLRRLRVRLKFPVSDPAYNCRG